VCLCLCHNVFTLSHKISNFRFFFCKNCFFIYCKLCTGNISHSKKQSVKYYHTSSFTVPLLLSDFKLNMAFLDRLSKNTQNVKFHICPSCGSRVVPWGQIDRRTEGQTGRLTVVFRNFTSAHRKENSSWIDDMSYIYFVVSVEYWGFRYRPGMAQRVPGILGSKIFTTFFT
jgi:hypothetical protein